MLGTVSWPFNINTALRKELEFGGKALREHDHFLNVLFLTLP